MHKRVLHAPTSTGSWFPHTCRYFVDKESGRRAKQHVLDTDEGGDNTQKSELEEDLDFAGCVYHDVLLTTTTSFLVANCRKGKILC